MHIEGKAALITGAGAGIGRAIAVALAEKGVRHLTLCDIDDKGLAETAALVQRSGAAVTRRRLDVADHQDCERALEEANHDEGLDIVINNAGIVAADYPNMPLERIARLISINLTAVITGTAVAARLMAARGGGVIVNTASMTAFRPRLADAPYRASKAGVVMLTRCCKELSAHGVRVNAIAPGITDTPMLDKAGDGSGSRAWLDSAMRDMRIRAPGEMAAAVVDLIEDDSKAGEVLELDNELLQGAPR
jgi:NAD(P)-dependent dehydrogenase (short-subunit alcohol dehydrogenase family)